ncbi:UNVERIFIED_CONTAM: hypothetical protein GTU68_047522 [Idotea baltica]|nr:hypothetical protein [Idotea baltica]
MALLSANLANADTPGYKARDIDFGAALSSAVAAANGVRATNTRYLSTGNSDAEVKYRTPFQETLDGNTVETDHEHAQFMDNAIRYQASLNFLERRVKGLLLALRGE